VRSFSHHLLSFTFTSGTKIRVGGAIGSFPNLTELDLSHNLLKKLPDFLDHFPKLKKIHVEGNPLATYPSYISKIDPNFPLDSSFWNWEPANKCKWYADIDWKAKGSKNTRYSALLVNDASDQGISDKFRLIAAQLGFDPRTASRLYAVSNEKLMVCFNNLLDLLGTQSGRGWENISTLSHAEQRQRFLDWHEHLANRCAWNSAERPLVIPMLQGTTEPAAWSICENGFGTTGTTDAGYYGSGIYFTSKFDYANMYAREKDGVKWFLVSLVIPGHTFPVVEDPYLPDGSVNEGGYLGKAGRHGYHSHLTMVDGSQANALPLKGETSISTVADELVIFSGNQALPLFVFAVKYVSSHSPSLPFLVF